jgi:predicted MPP superfamily phosphohydrolase
MRTSFIITAILFIFIFLPDLIIFQELKKQFKKKWPLILHVSISSFFLVGILLLFLLVRSSHDEDEIQLFMWFNWLLLLVYLPKVIFSIFILLDRLAAKIIPTIRHLFIYIGLFLASVTFIAFIYGAFKGRLELTTDRVAIHIAELPKTFNGFKIIQISDLHIGNLGHEPRFWQRIVDSINAEKPDLIVMTGDMMNNFANELTPNDIALFSTLRAQYGKIAILGNHDYGDYTKWPSKEAKQANLDSLEQRERRMGFRLLLDEHLFIVKNHDSIAIAGVQNWSKPPFHCYGNLPKAMNGIENFPFVILLTHDPNHWMAQAVNYPTIFLTLSGHTHAMQFGINRFGIHWSPAEWMFKQWDGLYVYENKYLYVNRGLGYIGVPIRIGMPPEISIITLIK